LGLILPALLSGLQPQSLPDRLTRTNPEVVHSGLIPSGHQFSWRTKKIRQILAWADHNVVQPFEVIAEQLGGASAMDKRVLAICGGRACERWRSNERGRTPPSEPVAEPAGRAACASPQLTAAEGPCKNPTCPDVRSSEDRNFNPWVPLSRLRTARPNSATVENAHLESYVNFAAVLAESGQKAGPI
jgi:hypothetical protein